jgi:hypothetical protein
MWRYLAGGAAILLLAGAGATLLSSRGHSGAPLLAATAREQKRFDRYDKDRNGQVTREEYLAQRRKAYAKLDTNHDGVLSFDEWAVKAETKFASADGDKSGAMNPTEFATTAVKRSARPRPKCRDNASAPAEPSEDS